MSSPAYSLCGRFVTMDVTVPVRFATRLALRSNARFSADGTLVTFRHTDHIECHPALRVAHVTYK
jgi:hypothetical protein